MQTAGHLIRTAAELAARMQHREDRLDRGLSGLGIDSRRHAAAIVFYRDDIILVYRHPDRVRIPSHCLINSVIDNFPYQMMKTFCRSTRNIHARTLSDSLQTIQNLNITVAVLMGHFGIQLFSENRMVLIFFLGNCHILFLLIHHVFLPSSTWPCSIRNSLCVPSLRNAGTSVAVITH